MVQIIFLQVERWRENFKVESYVLDFDLKLRYRIIPEKID